MIVLRRVASIARSGASALRIVPAAFAALGELDEEALDVLRLEWTTLRPLRPCSRHCGDGVERRRRPPFGT